MHFFYLYFINVFKGKITLDKIIYIKYKKEFSLIIFIMFLNIFLKF